MAASLQTLLWNEFSWSKIYVFFFIEIPLTSARKGPDDNNYAFKSGNEWQGTEQIFKGCCLQQRSHIQLYPPS